MPTIFEQLSPAKQKLVNRDLGDLYAAGKKIPAVPKDLPEPSLSENAWYIGHTRYALRNEKGEPVETPKELFWRIAYNIATADRLYARGNKPQAHLKTAKEFYKMMSSQAFIPNTPTMLNAGKPNQQLSACFVLPVEDDLEGIMKSAFDMARIHRSGGGTGFSFSRLRPKDDILRSSGGKTTGPISFMQMYNDITSSVRQGGVRRGANMGILHYNHPDILLFAVYKVDEFSLTNFNISVTVDEAFLEKVKSDAKYLDDDYEKDFDFDGIVANVREAHQTRDMDLKNVLLDTAVKRLREWCNETDPKRGYELINPRNGQVAGRLNAKKVFDVITRLAWNYGDPGMIIMDRINNSRANPTPKLGLIEATNPCGEQPLLPYDACTLGSINLSKFVVDGAIDWDGLKDTTHLATHFLDNVLDMNEYPIDEVRQTTRAIRRIGLGIMGFADALLDMGVGYNTEEGLAVAEEVMEFIQKESDNASVDLAKTRGVFPAFDGSIYDVRGGIRPRNGARTTIAPTGTIAMLADCSSGCEPLFALTYAKNTIEGKRIFQTSSYFVKALQERGLYSEELLERIQDNGGSIQNMDEIPEDLKRVFVVAGDILPEWHVRMQAAFQRFTDNAISKTINFNNDATIEDVRNAYWMVYETGCKGITIYRDGSREKQVLEVKKDNSYYDQLTGKRPTAVGEEAMGEGVPLEDLGLADHISVSLRPRPLMLRGRTYKKSTPVGSAFISVNEDDLGNIFEVFINVGHAGSDITADAEALGRLITLAFRIPSSYSPDMIAQSVAEALHGIGGASSSGFGAQRVRSLADAVSQVIAEHLDQKNSRQLDFEVVTVEPMSVSAQEDAPAPTATNLKTLADFCPECGVAALRFIEGCQKCESCGFSKC